MCSDGYHVWSGGIRNNRKYVWGKRTDRVLERGVEEDVVLWMRRRERNWGDWEERSQDGSCRAGGGARGASQQLNKSLFLHHPLCSHASPPELAFVMSESENHACGGLTAPLVHGLRLHLTVTVALVKLPVVVG